MSYVIFLSSATILGGVPRLWPPHGRDETGSPCLAMAWLVLPWCYSCPPKTRISSESGKESIANLGSHGKKNTSFSHILVDVLFPINVPSLNAWSLSQIRKFFAAQWWGIPTAVSFGVQQFLNTMLVSFGYMMLYVWLVVLTCFNHLEKYEFVNGKDDIPYIMENSKCSKPPNQCGWNSRPRR